MFGEFPPHVIRWIVEAHGYNASEHSQDQLKCLREFGDRGKDTKYMNTLNSIKNTNPARISFKGKGHVFIEQFS